MKNPMNRDSNDTAQLSAQLEQRLRSHYRQTYGPDTDPDAVWTRIAPQLGPQQQRRSWAAVLSGAAHLRTWATSVMSPRSIPGLSSFALLLLVLALGVWAYPTPLSAQQILEQAQAAHAAPVVESYHLQATQRDQKAAAIHIEEWALRGGYQRQERIFYDTQGAMVATQGTVKTPSQIWEYETRDGQTQVVEISADNPAADSKELRNPNVSLEDLLDGYSRKCQTAVYQGEATVIGRAAYQIELVPNQQQCSIAAKPGEAAERVFALQQGRRLLWLDQQTLVLLKWEQYDQDATLQASYEVTSV
ncbi:MAG TPA: hypothetical protein VGD69_33050, partial [Herpetosiphonaceae bacterium]